MKKWLIVLFAIMLTLTAVSCGGGQSSGSGNKSIEGEWIEKSDDGERQETLTIDGENALLELWIGSPMKGTVNRDEQTITFNKSNNDETIVCTYEIIGDKLVIESDDLRTISFEKDTSDKEE